MIKIEYFGAILCNISNLKMSVLNNNSGSKLEVDRLLVDIEWATKDLLVALKHELFMKQLDDEVRKYGFSCDLSVLRNRAFKASFEATRYLGNLERKLAKCLE